MLLKIVQIQAISLYCYCKHYQQLHIKLDRYQTDRQMDKQAVHLDLFTDQ